MIEKIKNIFKTYGFKNMLFKNFLFIFSFIVISFTVIGSLLFFTVNRMVINQVAGQAYTTTENFSFIADSKIAEISKTLSSLDLNANVRLFMSNGKDNKIMESNNKIVSELISNTAGINKYIYSISVYSDKDKSFISSRPVQENNKELYKNFLEESTNCNNVSYRKIDGVYPNVMTLMRIYERNGQRLGYVVIDVDFNTFGNFFEMAENSPEFLIYLSDNTFNNVIVYNKDYSKFLMEEQNEKIKNFLMDSKNCDVDFDSNYIYCKVKSEKYAYTYLTKCNMNEFYKNIKYYGGLLIIFLIIFILIGAVAAFYISCCLSSKVIYLIDVLNGKEERKNKKKINEKDIDFLAEGILQIVERNEILEGKIFESIEMQKQLQIQVMQKQITPHFLSNTLELINNAALRELGIHNDISAIAINLSHLLKHSLFVGKAMIEIKEEVDFLRSYVDIMKLRYPHCKVEIDVPEEIMTYHIVRLTLQPIAENAFRYVFEGESNIPTVKITAFQQDDIIIFNVFDNGIGMSEQEIKKIFLRFAEKDNMSEHGIGLKNVYRRLKLLFGDKADLKIKSEKNKYTRISIIIPKI